MSNIINLPQASNGEFITNADASVPLLNWEQTTALIEQSLPQMLVSLLERRYLSGLQPEGCDIFARAGDNTLPLMREVQRLGRPSAAESWGEAMPGVLTACHDRGHALVMALHGEGDRHRLYFGARRLAGQGAGSTEDFVEAQSGAYKAFMPGLQTGPDRRMDEREMPELADTLHSAMSLAVLTGIPGGSGGGLPFELRSLDRLVKAVGNHRYALMVVAEPVDAPTLDATIDTCRRLKSEIHSYTRATKSQTEGTSNTVAHTDKESTSQSHSKLPAALVGVAVFLELAGHLILPGAGAIVGALGGAAAGMAQPLMGMATMARLQESQDSHSSSRQISEGQSQSQGSSRELLDANAEACEVLLQQYIDRLETGRSNGWWQTAVYIAAHSDAALQSVSGAVRSLCSGPGSKMDPIRALPLPTHLLRQAITHGQILRVLPAGRGYGHPLGPTFDALATCINAEELAGLMHLPHKEIPGLPMRDVGEFALSVPLPEPDTILLGHLQDSAGRDLTPVTLASETLNRHVFVTGMTGYGKTNTCMQLLLQSDSLLQTPFLVLEPAKTEYRQLKRIPGLGERLNVYSLGGTTGLPFRLNPLAPIPGIPLSRHIDLLKAVFNASFPMYAGMPYVLEEAILEVYRERGWSLFTSDNPFLTPDASHDERAALTPCLEDLHDKIEVVLKRKSYAQEIHMNMGAALRSRIHSLMVGSKGMVFNTRRSTPASELFDSPTVIELQNLGDDEEKAFVMALLFVMLYEYAEVRQSDVPANKRGKLQHLTLVEEAHRLLTATHGGGNPEVGDPRAKAVTMFTDMLAEMRAYGEGFIIADQIPTKLAPETLKNSNLKIVHRLSAPDDREITGQCLNLTPAQIRHINNLTPGLAVVHDERIGEAVLTRVAPVKTTLLAQAAVAAQPRLPSGSRTYLHRHGGCRHCESPCDFYPRLEEAQLGERLRQTLDPLLESVLLGLPDEGQTGENATPRAWGLWQNWRAEWESASPLLRYAPAALRPGLTYCAVTHAAGDWLGRYLLARGPQRPDALLTPEDRQARERALLAFGTLLRDWQARAEWDGQAQAIWRKQTGEIHNAVAPAPPFLLAGCAECPARCRMLAFVNPHLGRLDKLIRPRLLQSASGEDGLRALNQALTAETNGESILARLDPDARRKWQYCLLVNLHAVAPAPRAAQTVREDMLARLRQPEQ